MIKGEESLQREVYRRRKERGDWIGDLPVQPGPVFPHNSEKVVAAIPWGSLEDGACNRTHHHLQVLEDLQHTGHAKHFGHLQDPECAHE